MVFVLQLWPQSNSESSSSRQRLAHPFSCRVQLSPNSHGVKGYLGSRPPSGVYVRSYHVLQRTSCNPIDSCSFFKVKNWNHQLGKTPLFASIKHKLLQREALQVYLGLTLLHKCTGMQKNKQLSWMTWFQWRNLQNHTKFVGKSNSHEWDSAWARLKGTLCTSLDLICIPKISQDHGMRRGVDELQACKQAPANFQRSVGFGTV